MEPGDASPVWITIGNARMQTRASLFGGLDRAQVQPLAHFLARLEIGHALGRDFHGFAGARVAAGAAVAGAIIIATDDDDPDSP